MGRGDVARLADFTLGLGAALRPDRTDRPHESGDPISTRVGPVEVRAGEGRLSFYLDSGEAWRLVASAFAGDARLAVEQDDGIVTFALRAGQNDICQFDLMAAVLSEVHWTKRRHRHGLRHPVPDRHLRRLRRLHGHPGLRLGARPQAAPLTGHRHRRARLQVRPGP